MTGTPNPASASPSAVRAAAPPRTVGVVVHGARADAISAARDAVTRLRGSSVDVVGADPEVWDGSGLTVREARSFGEGLDLIVAFGGDGTLLRAAYLARDQGVPLFGVNLGRLGFLSEVEAAELEAGLGRLLEGDYTVDERMTLAVEVHDADGAVVGSSWALNEASVERVSPQRLMVFEVGVSGTNLARVPADAIICATPTGSTAYAFSARGPIVSPLVQAILLVPVAPHSLFDRTIVVDAGERLEVEPVDGGEAAVSLDGRESIRLPDGGSVRVVRGNMPVRMVRLGEFDFYRRVRDKFGLR
ncbi:NAD(+)/NADH kinase [Egibacter rhizosphaerae]|uniref:NAD(+)/NADH kinase n=1 Tax=Egibacter rhizosphaerae TaxID=1670831 RepID=UPI0013F16460|nr:NAD(+)/NADH kinase [Egibacter rhizosphaerae]